MRYIISFILFCTFIFSAWAQTNNTSRQYDALGRIKQETYADSIVITYQYDATGNRISRYVSCLRLIQMAHRDTICEGETFSIGQNRYTVSDTYRDTFRRTTGCDSVVVTHLFVKSILRESQSRRLCSGDTVRVGSHIYSTTGNYPDTFAVNTEGVCKRILTTNLTISPDIRRTMSICKGDSVQVFGNWVKTTGPFFKQFRTNSNTCDSSVTVTVNVVAPIRRSIDTTLCSGSFLIVDGKRFQTAGLDSIRLRSVSGCDSVVTVVKLQYRPLIFNATTISICEGETYSIGQNRYSVSGTYRDTFRRTTACDSIVQTTLIVKIILRELQTRRICSGDTIRVGTHIYSLTGNYQDTFAVNTEGVCKRILTTNLTVSPDIRRTISICKGDSVRVFGNWVKTSGALFQRFPINSNTCDSSVTVTVNVVAPIRRNIDTTLCNGSFLDIDGKRFQTAGLDSVRLRSVSGCDSVTTVVKLQYRPVFSRDTTVNICAGETFKFGTQTLNQPGVYTGAFRSIYGCDSTVKLVLNIQQKPIANFTTSTNATLTVTFTNTSTNVNGYTWLFGDGTSATSTNPTFSHNYPSLGSYTVTLIVKNGSCKADTMRQTIIVPNCTAFKGNVIATTTTCKDNSGTIRVAEKGAMIRWNNTTDTIIKNLAVGTYQITVEVGTCRFPNTVDIKTASPPVKAAITPNGHGLIAVAIDGTPPFHYQWNDKDTNWVRSNLPRDSFYVIITDSKGCEAKAGYFHNIGEANADVNLFIAPNPTDGFVTVSGWFKKSEEYECLIHDVLGRLVWQKPHAIEKTFKFDIDLTGYPNGTYILTLRTESFRKVVKIVKVY
jgi:YD repeat-containing protein